MFRDKRVEQTAVGFANITGLFCRCGGQLRVQDWRPEGSPYREHYEVFCVRCKTRDPNGHSSLKAAVDAAPEYFGSRSVPWKEKESSQ